MSSLTSTATRESKAEKTECVTDNTYPYGQEEMMNGFEASFEDTFDLKESMFEFDEEDVVQEIATPRKRRPEKMATSPSRIVTEISGTLTRDGGEEKV